MSQLHLTGSSSYPTFWDAIPLEAPPNPAPTYPPPVPLDAAYAEFLDAVEEGPIAPPLAVEQTGIG